MTCLQRRRRPRWPKGGPTVSLVDGPEAALPLVDALETDLGDYHLLHSARGDMLRRLGRDEDAVVAYRRALKLAPTESERRFLERRIGALTGA